MKLEENGLYDLDQVSELLRMTKWSVRKKIREGKIPGHRIGNRLLIFGRDLIDYVKRQGRNPKGGFARNDNSK